MSRNPLTYRLLVPKKYIGEVLAELNKRGGIYEESSNMSEMIEFHVSISKENMYGFEEWLSKLSGGVGKVTVSA